MFGEMGHHWRVLSRAGTKLDLDFNSITPATGFFFNSFLNFIYFFLERGERREKEEKNTIVHLPLTHPLLGTWPTTQACALTGNRTTDPLVCRPALNLLSHTSQDSSYCFDNRQNHEDRR